jgi:copper(I)-binding protein
MSQFRTFFASVVSLFCAASLLANQALADVSVEGAWVRATPPGARTGAVYLTLNNDGPADALIRARTDVAERAELHTHVHIDGMMRMEPVASIAIPAGGAAELKPHGDHLMLVGLRQPLVAGSVVVIEFEFEGGETVELDVPVRDGRAP